MFLGQEGLYFKSIASVTPRVAIDGIVTLGFAAGFSVFVDLNGICAFADGDTAAVTITGDSKNADYAPPSFSLSKVDTAAKSWLLFKYIDAAIKSCNKPQQQCWRKPTLQNRTY